MSPEFTEDGQRLYYCLNCRDAGWVYPVNPKTGTPDYGKAIRCRCRTKIEEQQDFPVEHAERPSRRRH